MKCKPSVIHLGNLDYEDSSEHKLKVKFRNISLTTIKLTTVLSNNSVDLDQLYLAESGVKGTMAMMVLGKQLKFKGTLLSPYDFLFDIKDFII